MLRQFFKTKSLAFGLKKNPKELLKYIFVSLLMLLT